MFETVNAAFANVTSMLITPKGGGGGGGGRKSVLRGKKDRDDRRKS